MSDAPDDWIWTRYWQYDRLASCMDGPSRRNYDERIAAAWRAFFADLEPGSRILDLCTGNGAVPVIAAEAGADGKKGFEIVAVDQADIDPAGYVNAHRDELRSVDFCGGVRVEALPFPDRSFDAVVSQYGLEYSDLRRSVPEAMRVLAPGGRLRMVMHGKGGLVTAEAEAAIADARLLLDQLDVVGHARRSIEAVTAVERGAEPDEAQLKAADAAFADFQAAVAAAVDYLPSANDAEMVRDSVATLVDTFKKRGYFEVADLLAKADEVESEIVAHKLRLEALIAAAVGDAEMNTISRLLQKAGATKVEWSPVRDFDEALIGYAVEGRIA